MKLCTGVDPPKGAGKNSHWRWYRETTADSAAAWKSLWATQCVARRYCIHFLINVGGWPFCYSVPLLRNLLLRLKQLSC